MSIKVTKIDAQSWQAMLNAATTKSNHKYIAIRERDGKEREIKLFNNTNSIKDGFRKMTLKEITDISQSIIDGGLDRGISYDIRLKAPARFNHRIELLANAKDNRINSVWKAVGRIFLQLASCFPSLIKFHKEIEKSLAMHRKDVAAARQFVSLGDSSHEQPYLNYTKGIAAEQNSAENRKQVFEGIQERLQKDSGKILANGMVEQFFKDHERGGIGVAVTIGAKGKKTIQLRERENVAEKFNKIKSMVPKETDKQWLPIIQVLATQGIGNSTLGSLIVQTGMYGQMKADYEGYAHGDHTYSVGTNRTPINIVIKRNSSGEIQRLEFETTIESNIYHVSKPGNNENARLIGGIDTHVKFNVVKNKEGSFVLQSPSLNHSMVEIK
jgi:hypothetical protein